MEFLISPILRAPPSQDKPSPPARAGSPVGTVLLALFLSGMATAFSMYFLGQNLDGRLAVTTVDTFHDFFSLRDLFLAATSYPLQANPASLAHGVFEYTPDSLQEWQDLRNRRLITAADYDARVTGLNASTELLLSQHRGDLLWNILRISWCSYPNALPGTTPTTRSPGCACIGKAYLEFIKETAGNLTGAVTINTTLAARDKYSSQAVTCFDQRQVSRTQTCGLVCTTHAMDLMLFINSVTFLFLCSYLLFSEHGTTFLAGLGAFTQLLVLKVVVVLLAALLAVPFIVYDLQAHVPNLCGLVLSVVYITVTLHDQLDFPGMREAMEFVQRRYTGSKRRPHPLTATLLIHLQLILPAYGVIVCASGYGRDTWAILSFGTALWLMGLAMQRFFWAYWYSDRDDSLVNQGSLLASFVALLILLILLFCAYYYDGSLYMTGSVWFFTLFAVYLALMFGLLLGDRVFNEQLEDCSKCSSFYYNMYQEGMLWLTLLFNTLATVVVAMDSANNRPPKLV